LYRQISKEYQSVYGNAFTENTIPVNEKGLYAGSCLRPHQRWKIDLYADVFSFGWLKYRVDAPSHGSAYLVQVTYRPTKKSEVYIRFRQRFKPLNDGDEDGVMEIPEHHYIYNIRTHLNFQVSRVITLRCRAESLRITYPGERPMESGYLFYAEIHYKPARFLISGNLRLAAFEAQTYNSRLYTYESDVLYANSIPSFYNNGVRYYVNLKAKIPLNDLIDNQLTVNVKVASTLYSNISTIGTGDGLISKNRISAIRLQFFLSL
jgi:hypothetical protein